MQPAGTRPAVRWMDGRRENRWTVYNAVPCRGGQLAHPVFTPRLLPSWPLIGQSLRGTRERFLPPLLFTAIQLRSSASLNSSSIRSSSVPFLKECAAVLTPAPTIFFQIDLVSAVCSNVRQDLSWPKVKPLLCSTSLDCTDRGFLWSSSNRRLSWYKTFPC